MAIWQATFELIKEKNILDCSKKEIWKIVNELIVFLPEEKSWCDSIRQFGKLDSTCIQMDFENGEIFLRIDLRNITKKQLDMLVNFAESNALKIKHENTIEEPTIRNFVEILKSTEAYRFVRNPQVYLEAIAGDS